MWRLSPADPAALGTGFWDSVVIGDFTEAEAHEFFKMQLGDRQELLDKASWAKVYEVCHFCACCGDGSGALRRGMHADTRLRAA